MKPDEHEEAIDLFLKQHALLYSRAMDHSEYPTMEDDLLEGIKEETLRQYPVNAPDTRNSIVWHLWHIARIEDMTMNVLVNGSDQIFHTNNWFDKMKVNASHSGNEMETEEVAELSSTMDIEELLLYRLAVGRQTRDIMKSLRPGQLKNKVESARLRKLTEQGAVKDKAQWLIDYWGSKTVAGLVLMPATRHNFLHLNRSMRIKNKYQR
ncbi:DinB family protein [Cohnella faecalis]|uniref:DinB family protein n=1 Tax=Cohnella faecalis TaxID=2315694 RepID=UPI002D77D66E|nr:DinB family protein [Cohnella faecalis]